MKTAFQILTGMLCEVAWVAHNNVLTFGAVWLTTLTALDWDRGGFYWALLILMPILAALLIVLTWFGLPTHKATLYGAPILLIGYLMGFGDVFLFIPLPALYIMDYVHWTVAALIFTIGTLALQNLTSRFWTQNKSKISLFTNILGVILFVVSQQPYAATILIIFLVIKTLMLIKW